LPWLSTCYASLYLICSFFLKNAGASPLSKISKIRKGQELREKAGMFFYEVIKFMD